MKTDTNGVQLFYLCLYAQRKVLERSLPTGPIGRVAIITLTYWFQISPPPTIFALIVWLWAQRKVL